MCILLVCIGHASSRNATSTFGNRILVGFVQSGMDICFMK